ncbi:hypothetical protein [Bacillus swezeyi]|uniref:hypothetical protein n=1 Tax=Bacillus swezeyi TaxID=1925020 RepID=UPI001CC23C9C|nr:hypothetical protein [Bacillus swezeyi]
MADLYIFGFVMLSRWSFSFDEIFGAAIQPYFNLRERFETLFFTNQRNILIALALGVLLSCTAYSLQHSLPSITIALLTITSFLIIGISGFLPACFLKPANSES